jgi:hypothetical protein
MPDQERKAPAASKQKTEVYDAVRHVGPTLESEGVFLPSDELPENRIAAEGLVEDTVNMRAVTADDYDREAEAMGAEPLRTRLPGDTSSEPHTNVGPDNATVLDDDKPHRNPSNNNRSAA